MAQSRLSIGIVGGGIGGAAAALALTRAGIDATVYERAPELREVGAGLMLWPNATRVLKEFGVLDRLAAHSGSSHSFLVRASSGAVLMDIALGCFDSPALCARRSDLLAALVSAVPPGIVRLGQEFERFEESPDGVMIHFTNGVAHRHDFLIGADGIRSRVRARLFGAHDPIFRGYTIWRGLARLKGISVNGSNSETWGHGKRFGILHTGGDRFTWYASANTAPGHADSAHGRQHDLLRLFHGWHYPIGALIEATPAPTILKNGAADLSPLRRWGRGRVMLLGDAAHPCTPNLGLGGCMALEDAAVLARSFLREATPEIALRRYETLRRARTRQVQRRSLLMGSIAQWENRMVAGGRQIVTRMLPARIFERNLRRLYSYAA